MLLCINSSIIAMYKHHYTLQAIPALMREYKPIDRQIAGIFLLITLF
jgi:hypothetical protein